MDSKSQINFVHINNIDVISNINNTQLAIDCVKKPRGILISKSMLYYGRNAGFPSTICDNIEFYTTHRVNVAKFALSWGNVVTGLSQKCGVMETGFFFNAAHIDTRGLYHNSSLNYCDYSSFKPNNYIDFGLLKSKFKQPNSNIEWHGVVFACQNPTDRSITSVGNPNEWWKFYERCCKYYGKLLLVKLHPWNSGGIEKRIIEIANKYGCMSGKFNCSCIEKCDHVVLFNSTFSVDCMVYGVKVKQGYPGYFHNTGAVTFCDGDPSRKLDDTAQNGYDLINFLIWKYCFPTTLYLHEWKAMLRAFADSSDVFPLPIEFSYASRLILH